MIRNLLEHEFPDRNFKFLNKTFRTLNDKWLITQDSTTPLTSPTGERYRIVDLPQTIIKNNWERDLRDALNEIERTCLGGIIEYDAEKVKLQPPEDEEGFPLASVYCTSLFHPIFTWSFPVCLFSTWRPFEGVAHTHESRPTCEWESRESVEPPIFSMQRAGLSPY